MKKQVLVLCCVAAMFTALLTSCSSNNSSPVSSPTGALAQKGTTGSGWFSAPGTVEEENYRRQTDPGTVVFHGQMVLATDNNHLIPVQFCGVEGVVEADMLDDDGLYRDFQFALTQFGRGQMVLVTAVIQDNLFQKDKFVITQFSFPAPMPIVVDTIVPVKVQPIRTTPVKPQPAPIKKSTKNDCGCCGNNVTVNAGNATVTVNNGSVSVKADSLTTKQNVEKAVVKDSKDNKENVEVEKKPVAKKSNKFLDLFKRKS